MRKPALRSTNSTARITRHQIGEQLGDQLSLLLTLGNLAVLLLRRNIASRQFSGAVYLYIIVVEQQLLGLISDSASLAFKLQAGLSPFQCRGRVQLCSVAV